MTGLIILFDKDFDFIEEFHSVVSDSKIKHANEEFTPDTYDDRYLNMELAVPRGDNPNPQYAKVMLKSKLSRTDRRAF